MKHCAVIFCALFALTFRRYFSLNKNFESSIMVSCGGYRRGFKREEFGRHKKNAVCKPLVGCSQNIFINSPNIP